MLCVLNGRRRRRMHGVQNDAGGLFAADERECRTVVRHIRRGDLFERCLQPGADSLRGACQLERGRNLAT